MNEKSVLVFDIDGTLTDSVTQHQRAFEEALNSFPFQRLDTNWANYRHHTDTGIFAEAWEREDLAGAPDFEELGKRYAKAYDAAVSQHPVTEIKGARRFIGEIDERWIVVFATGSLAYGARHKLAVIDVVTESHVLVTASEFQTREELVEHAVLRGCARHGFTKPRDVVSIGDGIWDLMTARNLGYEFVGIGCGAKADQLRRLGAEVHADFDALSVGKAGFRFNKFSCGRGLTGTSTS